MRKGEQLTIEIVDVKFPNKPYGLFENKKVYPKSNCIPGQVITGRIRKLKKDRIELGNVEVIQKAENQIEPECIHFELCGGCTYQHLSYKDQLELKERQIKKLFNEKHIDSENFMGIIPSKNQFAYRNKMELTFGNAEKDGPLTLGLHKRGSFYDIINIDGCKLMDEDFVKITNFTIDFFKKENLNFYHKMKHEGFLRNLVIRKGEFTGELLINLITTSQSDYDMSKWKEEILNLELSKKIIGLIWTINNNISDAVNSESEKIIHGKKDFHEKLLGYDFRISPYSFFQTNSSGAELLYSKILNFLPNTKDKIIFDLFSGTGTIGQIVSKNAGYVYGIELVEEAVEKANENAKLNKAENCKFIAGDVFRKVEELSKEGINPDIVILDPPRAGVGQKALEKILEFNMNEIIYVSCNPKTFVQDVEILMNSGFRMSKSICVDMFPNTPHVEIVSLLEKVRI